MPAKAKRPIPEFGRAQAPRPDAPQTVRAQAEGERALIGAFSVPIEQISPDPGQPRREMDPERLGELAASLKADGVLQPLVVREDGYLDDGRTRYVIVAGGRRYAAAVQAGLTRLPVIVRQTEGAQMRVLQLLENLQRQDLSPRDEAHALVEISTIEDLDVRTLAARIHRSIGYVSDRMALVKHKDVEEAHARGEVATSTAAAIAREPDQTKRKDLLAAARSGRLGKSDIQRGRTRSATLEPTKKQERPSQPLRAQEPGEKGLHSLIMAAGGPLPVVQLLQYAVAHDLALTDILRAANAIADEIS